MLLMSGSSRGIWSEPGKCACLGHSHIRATRRRISLASGMILQGLGDFDISILEAEKGAGAGSRTWSPAYTNLAYSYFLEGRMSEAHERTWQKASGRGLNPPEILVLRYAIAFAAGDTEGMKRAASAAAGKPWAKDWMTQTEALAAADRGQIRLARQLSRKAMEQANRMTGQPDRAAGYESAIAVDETYLWFPKEAIRAATQALQMSHGRDVEYTAALAFGVAGDVQRGRPMFSGRICMTGFRRTQR